MNEFNKKKSSRRPAFHLIATPLNTKLNEGCRKLRASEGTRSRTVWMLKYDIQTSLWYNIAALLRRHHPRTCALNNVFPNESVADQLRALVRQTLTIVRRVVTKSCPLSLRSFPQGRMNDKANAPASQCPTSRSVPAVRKNRVRHARLNSSYEPLNAYLRSCDA